MSAPSVPAVELMHPTLVRQPFHRDGWVYEEKVDGYRMLACSAGGAARLLSRNARDHTTRFPGVAAAVRALGPAPLMLDGEVAVFDRELLSRFEWIRHRRPPDLATPPVFIAFDCLQAKGKDLRALPLHRRRAILETLLDDQALVLLPVRRLASDGLQAWQDVLARGYEGLVAKDPASPYRGGRTLSWLKVKQSDYRVAERGWSPHAAG